MQFTKQTIGHVVPVVLNLISQWNRMTVTNTYRKLCDLLIIGFQRKFAHEINSPVYAVASLFVVSKLKCWLKRTDSLEFRDLGAKNITQVAMSFLAKKNKVNLDSSLSTNPTLSASSSCQSLAGFLKDDNYEGDSPFDTVTFAADIEKERIDFLHLVEKNALSKSMKSTSGFWLHNEKKLPTLTKLSLILYNIPASSAYIERFYSICGNICKSRAGNMSAQTIITKPMLKANIKILHQLTSTQFNE
jgi:hypothetical protein